MNNEKLMKYMYIVVPILLTILSVLSYIKFINTDTTDAIKFKLEYEELNKEYKKVNINSNNPIIYADYDKLYEVIEKGTGIIYLGFPECPWCRSVVPVLIDASLKNNVKEIYYMNILNERDSYVVEDDKLVYAKDEDGKEKKGTKGYFRLLELLDEHLTDYIISFKDETYEVGEKRIYAPTVIFVKNGKILGLHVSTVESHKNPSDNLTKKQYNELYSIYEDYIIKIKGLTCNTGSSC